MLFALFVLTFFESIAATLIQRGLYFYTHEQLGFSQSHNLWIAFGFGVTYIAGAMVSVGAEVRAVAAEVAVASSAARAVSRRRIGTARRVI